MIDINTTRTRTQLKSLARHISTQQKAILQRWHTLAEKDPELIITSSLTRPQFNDHIPGVLDSLSDKLRSWPDGESSQDQQNEDDMVTAHSLQRWQQGYQLPELTREWSYLQETLMGVLEAYVLTHPDLEPAVMPTARSALADLCWDGICECTTHFWELRQTEAATRVRELEQAMAALKVLDQARAEGWRLAAHDLGGSVIALKGAASLLETDETLQGQASLFDLLQGSILHLHELLNELMSLARLEAGQEQRNIAAFDAAELLAKQCKTTQPLADQRGLYLKMTGPDSLLVEGDRVKVQRILQNLLINALKYTKKGGVTVIWEAGTDQNNTNWQFSVQDTGPGLNAGPGEPLATQLHEATQAAREVDDKHAPDMEPGHSTDEPTNVPAESQTLHLHLLPGEGVGLSIVKRLCELLDASLELETDPGEGTTFRVTLPRQYNKG